MRFLRSLCCLASSHEPIIDLANSPDPRSPGAKAVVPPKLTDEPYTSKATERLFESYADEDDPSVIGPEGFEHLFNDAQIPLDGPMPLLLAWQLSEAEMAKISKENWAKGMDELQISSLAVLALSLNELHDLIILMKPPIVPSGPKKPGEAKEPYNRRRYWSYSRDPREAFGEFYSSCYKLAARPGSRNIEMETAQTLWTVILAPTQPTVIEVVEFINEAGSYKAVNKDLWAMMLEFCRTINSDLSNYEADVLSLPAAHFLPVQAWPTMIDDFVEWKKAKDRPLGERTVNVD
ncbi:DUF298-domain-containing protein [Vararia minispora EC-137]|uniref:DUF298-domain-containing protein n=1 Tax=Vararia minispora EC-137 TaxID=1314806 RepID=A0ACB8QJA7_9AGAM|nr:DUF298-domain-containing protein [Vararia minispora EC-137]